MMTSRLQQMLNAKDRLPANLRALFDALFVQGLSEEQACAKLSIDMDNLRGDKKTLIRSLRAAA